MAGALRTEAMGVKFTINLCKGLKTCAQVIFMRKEGKKLKKYKYLRRDDRKRLAEMYERGDSISEIATAMDVHPNTVYNEIKRGDTGKLDVNQRREYNPEKAQKCFMDGLRRRGANFAAAK